MKIQVVVVDVRCAEITGNREGVGGGITRPGRYRGRIKHRDTRLNDRIAIHVRWKSRIWIEGNKDGISTDGIVSRTRIKRVFRELAGKKILRESIVKHAKACAEYRFALSEHIPCNAGARAKVVKVLRIQLAFQNETDCRIVNAELASITDHSEVIPAKTKIHRNLTGDAKTVLSIQCVRILGGKTRCISGNESNAIRCASKEIL